MLGIMGLANPYYVLLSKCLTSSKESGKPVARRRQIWPPLETHFLPSIASLSEELPQLQEENTNTGSLRISLSNKATSLTRELPVLHNSWMFPGYWAYNYTEHNWWACGHRARRHPCPACAGVQDCTLMDRCSWTLFQINSYRTAVCPVRNRAQQSELTKACPLFTPVVLHAHF